MLPIRSLKFRLTVLYAGIFAVFLIVFSVGILYVASTRAWKDFDRDLERDAQVYASLVDEEWRELQAGMHTKENWLEELKSMPALLHASACITGVDGTVLYRSPELDAISGKFAASPDAMRTPLRTEYFAFERHGGWYRVASVDLSKDKGSPFRLEFSRSMTGLSRYLGRMRLAVIGGIPLLIALAFIAGYYFIKRTIQPVEVMAGLAREISAGDLSRRVPLPSSEGEFRQLALTLNDMLFRLEEGFAKMKTFTANAAHELRNPIATVRSALETSLGRSSREMQESIHEALEELARLTEITEKLFLLARADSGRLLGEVRPVILSEIAAQVAAAFEGPAVEKGMSIKVEGEPASVEGDTALMRRAIHNLVENAVKYGREGGEIRIRTGPGGVEVRNDGPTISPEHLAHIFDRFFRADPARSDRVPGMGLGLAIVKSIVEAHGGSVSAESADGRTTFTITLPGVSPARPAAVQAG